MSKRFVVALRFDCEVDLDVDAADERAAELLARDELHRRIGVLATDPTDFSLTVGRYGFPVRVFPEFLREAETVDVEMVELPGCLR